MSKLDTDLLKLIDLCDQLKTELNKKKRGLLILNKNFLENSDSGLKAKKVLLGECVKNNVIIFEYNSTWTTRSFLYYLKRTLQNNFIQTESLGFVGWVFHNNGNINCTITSDTNINLFNYTDVTQYQNLIDIFNFIEIFVAKPNSGKKRFDLIACDIAGYTEYQKMKQLLEVATDFDFAASTNSTGNGTGCDWTLESHNISMIDLYFKTETNKILSENNIIINLGWNKFWNSVKKTTTSVTNTVASGVTNAANTVANGTVNAANTVANGTVNAANTVANFTVSTCGKIDNELTKITSNMTDGLNDVGKNAISNITSMAKTIANSGKKFEEVASDITNKYANTLVKDVTKYTDFVTKTLAKDALSELNGFYNDLGSGTLDIIGDSDKFFKSVGSNIRSDFQSIDWNQVANLSQEVAAYIAAMDPTGISGLILAVADLTQDAVAYSSNKSDANLINLIISIINVTIAFAACAASAAGGAKSLIGKVMEKLVLPLLGNASSMAYAIIAYVNNPSTTNRTNLINACNQLGISIAVSVCA
jgi:hypothetical protein